MQKDSNERSILKKVIEQNLKRFWIIPMVSIPVSIGHIAFFYHSLSGPETIEYTWRLGIIFSHFALILLSLAMWGFSYVRRKKIDLPYKTTMGITTVLISLLMLMGVIIVLIDQLVTPAITPLLVVCLGVAVVFLIKPGYAVFMYLITYLIFFFALPYVQTNPEIVLTNRLNGLTMGGIGFALSYIFWKKNWTEQKQKLIIDRQNSELIEKAKLLEESNSKKDMLFSIIAHDLKSPFNAILGLSEVVSEQAKDKGYNDILPYVNSIRDSSIKVEELLTNLLKWSLSQSGRIIINPEQKNIATILDRTLELFSFSADKKSITISKGIESDIFAVVDEEMVSAIFRNLISNAIKFTKAHGKVDIKLSKENEHFEFEINDTGVGIKPTELDSLFKVKSTYSAKGTNNESGTGLGLILCNDFVDRHNGSILVESQLGKGTVFKVRIPLQYKQCIS